MGRVVLDAAVVAEFLSATALFRNCERAVIDKIAPHVAATEYAAGEIVFRAGSPDQGLGLVFSGRVAVRQVNAATGAAITVEEVRVGDSFGEVGAVMATVQAQEVVAEDTSTILLVGKDVVAQLISKIAPFGQALAKRMASKLVMASVNALRAGSAGPAMIAPINAPAAPAASNAPSPSAADGIKFVRISSYTINDKLLAMLAQRTIQQHRVLPLELRGKTLIVGMVDPYNIIAQSEVRRTLSTVEVEFVAIGTDDFNEAFIRFRLDPAATARGKAAEQISPDSIVYDAADQERDAAKAVGVIGDEVVQMANRIIASAIERNASDVHIEADTTGVRVRYRTQGQLIDWDQFVAPSYAKGLIARYKVLSGLDITERRLPQDGRIGLRIGRREIDLRVSTMPASRGEKIVMRLFEAANLMRPLENVFLEPRALAALRAIINKPYGALIIAGPTGSGKSSTLYASLGERKRTRPDTNIVTVEDPIEYRLSGITQVQVNHSVNLGFAKVLHAMLRQDPDVIMVGEVRDEDTAQIALEAAMTGHLLFTSLHANNAVGVIQRLQNLNCSRALIAQSLGLVAVQRLARKLCAKCAATEIPPPILLESLHARGLADQASPIPMPRAVGCAECNQTGYSGRIAVLEVLQMTDQVRAQIMADVPLAEIEKIATESGSLIPFKRYASYLMSRNLLTPSEALLTVA
ncbi:MAG: Flp pilus assembly complex ATPase component TadA [Kofleriaceae bacterium]|nr:Flp pilus assembly complex ATPase component TadA [Kofleriaceae bacterium]